MQKVYKDLRRPLELCAYGIIGLLAVYGFVQLTGKIATRDMWPISMSIPPGVAGRVDVPEGEVMYPPVPQGGEMAPPRETASTIYFAGCSSREVFYVVNRPARLEYLPEPMTLAQFKAKNPHAVALPIKGEVRDFVSVFCDSQRVGYITLEEQNPVPGRVEPVYRLYSYHPVTKVFAVVARSEMMPSVSRIPVIESISPNGQFAQLRAVVCYQCDAGPGPYVLMDLKTKVMQFVDTNFVPQVSFEWTGDGGKYRYKELTSIEGVCPQERMSEIDGSCRYIPAEVPFVYGEIKGRE